MPDLSRYAAQTRFAALGDEGQARLMAGRVLLVGCGALGSAIAESLVRAGVGAGEGGLLRIADRDFLERSNLSRQVLYTEKQADARLPKAIAAEQRLREINSDTRLDPRVADVTNTTLPELAEGVDVIIDGTDNFEARLLVNDYAVRHALPWVYGGVVGAEGRVMPIVPGETACLACLVPAPPAPGETPTCDTAGVLGPAVGVVASIQALEAMKLIQGARDSVSEGLTVVDLWSGRWRRLAVRREAECPCCVGRDFAWLDGRCGGGAAVLCGRGAVQLRPASGAGPLDLPSLRAQLAPLGEVTSNPFLVRLKLPADRGGHELTLFADGRAIVGGVENESEARTVLAKCVGV